MALDLDYGLAALKQGDLEAAIFYLERARAQYPDDFRVLLYLSGAYHQAKRDVEAARTLQRVVAIQPDSAQAYYNLGVSLDRLHRRDEAMAAVRHALELEPGYTLAQKVLKKWQRAMILESLSSPPPERPIQPRIDATLPLPSAETLSQAETPAEPKQRQVDREETPVSLQEETALRLSEDTPASLREAVVVWQAEENAIATQENSDTLPTKAAKARRSYRKPRQRQIDPVLRKEADTALKLAFYCLLPVGLLLGPLAVGKAMRLKRWAASYPDWSAVRVVQAALAIGILGMLLSLVEWSLLILFLLRS